MLVEDLLRRPGSRFRATVARGPVSEIHTETGAASNRHAMFASNTCKLWRTGQDSNPRPPDS